MAQDNVHADIQLSKVQYTTADAPLFQSILKTVRLQLLPFKRQDKPRRQHQRRFWRRCRMPEPPPDSRQLLNIGNALYLQNKYAQAIPPYKKAFELEKVEPQLDRNPLARPNRQSRYGLWDDRSSKGSKRPRLSKGYRLTLPTRCFTTI